MARAPDIIWLASYPRSGNTYLRSGVACVSVSSKARPVRSATRGITWRVRAVLTAALFSLSCSAMLASAAADQLEGGRTGNEFRGLELAELMDVEIVPISVLGTHTHLADEWMVGYEFMSMEMEGNRNGTTRVSTDDVLREFPVAPIKMTMEMHMPMLMYAPSDDLTLMAMLPYVRMKMNHVTRSGVSFTTKSEGVGDVELSGLYTFYRHNFDEHRFIAVTGLSLPTGSNPVIAPA